MIPVYNSFRLKDTIQPALTLYSDVLDPVYANFTVYVQASKPITGLGSGDITPTNCTISNFVQITAMVYSFTVVVPASSGNVSVQILANKCVDLFGNSNTESNTLTYEFIADEAVHDLQNAIISKATHYRGHTASFSDSTDSDPPNMYAGEVLCCKNNLKSTGFRGGTASPNLGLDMYNFGVIDLGWHSNVPADFISAIPLTTAQRAGNPITAFCYTGGGDDDKLEYIPLALGGRNSIPSSSPPIPATTNLEYSPGQTDIDLISRANAFRLEPFSPVTGNQSGSLEDGLELVDAIVSRNLSEGGWYTQFCHWGFFTEEADGLSDYFEFIGDLLESEDVYRGTYQIINEYYWVREAIDSVTGNIRTCTINYTKKYPGSPYENIITPIWIRFDLSETNYSGLDIAVTNGGKIRSMGNDIYYISAMLDFNNSSTTFDIVVTATPNYVNLNIPIVNRVGNSVTSDQPVKLSLFSKLKTDEFVTGKVTCLERQLNFDTSFTLAAVLNLVTRDYYLGFINNDGVSGLIEF